MSGAISYTICPNGADPSATPQICIEEVSFPDGGPTVAPLDGGGGGVSVAWAMGMRVEDAPTTAMLTDTCDPLTLAMDGNGTCPGGSFFQPSIPITLSAAPYPYGSLTEPALGWTIDTTAIATDSTVDTHVCGVPTCAGGHICNCAIASSTTFLVAPFESTLQTLLASTLGQQLALQLCVRSSMGPCPAGTAADSSGVCRYTGDPSNRCALLPSLFSQGC